MLDARYGSEDIVDRKRFEAREVGAEGGGWKAEDRRRMMEDGRGTSSERQTSDIELRAKNGRQKGCYAVLLDAGKVFRIARK